MTDLKPMIALLLAVAPLGAAAQVTFMTEDGTTTFSGRDFELPKLAETAHSPAEIAQTFQTICVGTAFDAAATSAAVAASGWKFTAQPFTLPFKEMPNNDPIGRWAAADATVSFTNGLGEAKKRYVYVPGPQCNLVVRPSKTLTVEVVRTAVQEVLDAEPSNTAEAVRKNGKPNKRYSPKWTVTRTDGRTAIVAVHRTWSSGKGGEDQIHLGVLAAQPAVN